MAAILISFSFFKEWERLRDSRSSHSTGAAFDFRNAVGVFAYELALGFRAVRLVAFPITLGFLAYRFAFRFGCLAVSHTVRLLTNSDTFRAVHQFTSFIRAFDFTFGLFAFDIANSVFRLSTGGVAFRGLAYGITNGRTVGVVTFP